MPAKDTNTSRPGLDGKEVLRELEVPFSPNQVQWRVTVTANDRRRGQIVPYTDPRAYTDRLNVLFSPQGWTRDYRVETMGNITRIKKGESILSGKVFVTCPVTISGLWAHSGTGEAWADDDNQHSHSKTARGIDQKQDSTSVQDEAYRIAAEASLRWWRRTGVGFIHA